MSLIKMIYMPLPSRNRTDNNIKPTILSDKWYDKQGYHYILKDNTLIVESNEFFSDSGYSIVDYVNDIPSNIDLNVILRLKFENNENELAGFNMLCNLLSTNETKRKVIIDISRLKFSEKMALDIDNIPDNVKITTLLDNDYKENYVFSNEYFESWALNTNENNFQILLTKLTPRAAERIKKMRDISFDFYQYAPSSIINGTDEKKSMYAYNWCCNNISYDITATNTDGSLKDDRKDASDPIITYGRKKGVCSVIIKISFSYKYFYNL